jgi:hypothetical protein
MAWLNAQEISAGRIAEGVWMVNLTLLEMDMKTKKDGQLLDTIVSCGACCLDLNISKNYVYLIHI